MDDISIVLWVSAGLVWGSVLGNYLAGVIEFRSWKWPFD